MEVFRPLRALATVLRERMHPLRVPGCMARTRTLVLVFLVRVRPSRHAERVGVFGESNATTGSGFGVVGVTTSASGDGIVGANGSLSFTAQPGAGVLGATRRQPATQARARRRHASPQGARYRQWRRCSVFVGEAWPSARALVRRRLRTRTVRRCATASMPTRLARVVQPAGEFSQPTVEATRMVTQAIFRAASRLPVIW